MGTPTNGFWIKYHWKIKIKEKIQGNHCWKFLNDEWEKRRWEMDSNRVRQKKKIQRSNIENNIDGI